MLPKKRATELEMPQLETVSDKIRVGVHTFRVDQVSASGAFTEHAVTMSNQGFNKNHSHAVGLKTIAIQTALSFADESDKPDAEGFLSMHCGPEGSLKTWRKYWFVLNKGTIRYWRHPDETAEEPQGTIA